MRSSLVAPREVVASPGEFLMRVHAPGLFLSHLCLYDSLLCRRLVLAIAMGTSRVRKFPACWARCWGVLPAAPLALRRRLHATLESKQATSREAPASMDATCPRTCPRAPPRPRARLGAIRHPTSAPKALGGSPPLACFTQMPCDVPHSQGESPQATPGDARGNCKCLLWRARVI